MPKLRKLPVNKMSSDYQSGFSLSEVSKKYGVPKPTVKRRLVQAGVKMRPAIAQRSQVVGADGKRLCGDCKKRLPASQFHKCKSRPDGLNWSCRKCWANYQVVRTLSLKYGLTLEKFAELLKKQGGGCRICGKKRGAMRAGKRLRLNIDHCHKTGKIRGLLCTNCNRGLGLFKDDPELLKKAAHYLQ